MKTALSAALLAAALLVGCGATDPSPPTRDPGGAAAAGSAPAAASGPVAAGGPAPRARSLPAGALRVQQVQIMDTNGFERPLPAAFGFVPVGWTTRGGVQWGRQFMCTNGYAFDWQAVSPDGAQTVAVLPQEHWEANNYGGAPATPGCAVAAIQSARHYLEERIARIASAARVVDYRARPDLAAKFAHLNAATPAPMGEMRTWVEAGEVLFEYEAQGRPMRGVLAAVTIFSLSRMAGLGGQTMDALSGTSLPAFLATAPQGALNLRITEAIRQSFLPNPEWEARIAGHNNAIARVTREETAKRARMNAEYNDYVSRIRSELADARATSDQRRQREFGEVIRGVETWDDANAPGGRVELSSLYDHAWRLNDGSYVLSDSANFDPWQDLGVEGRRLGRTE